MIFDFTCVKYFILFLFRKHLFKFFFIHKKYERGTLPPKGGPTPRPLKNIVVFSTFFEENTMSGKIWHLENFRLFFQLELRCHIGERTWMYMDGWMVPIQIMLFQSRRWLLRLWLLRRWLVRTWFLGTWLLRTWLVGTWLLRTWFVGTWLLQTWLLRSYLEPGYDVGD